MKLEQSNINMVSCQILFYFLHEKNQYGCGLCFMVFNTTFNSFIGGGTGVPGENYHTDFLGAVLTVNVW
jgi:hypothetical protein